MNTGLDSFSNPEGIGALYPFPGMEVALVVIAFALWIAWHVAQTKAENRDYAKALARYEQIGLEGVMRRGGGAHSDDGEAAIRPGAGGPGTTGRAEPAPPARGDATELGDA